MYLPSIKEWNTTLDLFSNETFYIGVYQNQHRSDPCISSRQCKYEQGELRDFMYRKGDKENEQIAFFEDVAFSLSSDFFGIGANETEFLPLDTSFIAEPSLIFLAWKGQSLLEEHILQVLAPQDGAFVLGSFGKHGYVIPKHLQPLDL